MLHRGGDSETSRDSAPVDFWRFGSEVQWRFDPVVAGSTNEAACVGEGVVTVQQVKTFSQSGGIVIQ